MNYYEHHIGDYAEATAHLTFIEDAAYSRLIRKYYASEKPLPADLKQVQRLVGARTKEEKCAVQAVLEEFFSLEDDGWHQERCDRSIADYLDGEPERVIKKANEDTRMKRHREERAKLFSLLNEAGQHAPWNISMNELRALVQRYCNVPPATPATETGNAPATAPATPATATQTPDTNHQTPDTNTQNKDTHSAGDLTREPDKPQRVSHETAICMAIRAEGIASTNPGHPDLKTLIDQGAEVQNFVAAARTARDKGKGFAYVLGIVKGQLNDAQALATSGQSATKTVAESGHQRAMRERFESMTGKTKTKPMEAIDVATRTLD